MSISNGNIIGAKRRGVRGSNELYDMHSPVNSSIQYVSNTTGFGTTTALTLTHPAGVAINDVCMLLHSGWHITTNIIQTAPSTFTTILTTSFDTGGGALSLQSSYKILTDLTNVTLPRAGAAGISGITNQAYTAIYFRMSSPQKLTLINTSGEGTSVDPAAQLRNPGFTRPIASFINIAAVNISTGTPAFSTQAPAFDATITNTAATNIETITGYKLFDAFTTSSQLIDMADLGNNILQSFNFRA